MDLVDLAYQQFKAACDDLAAKIGNHGSQHHFLFIRLPDDAMTAITNYLLVRDLRKMFLIGNHGLSYRLEHGGIKSLHHQVQSLPNAPVLTTPILKELKLVKSILFRLNRKTNPNLSRDHLVELDIRVANFQPLSIPNSDGLTGYEAEEYIFGINSQQISDIPVDDNLLKSQREESSSCRPPNELQRDFKNSIHHDVDYKDDINSESIGDDSKNHDMRRVERQFLEFWDLVPRGSIRSIYVDLPLSVPFSSYIFDFTIGSINGRGNRVQKGGKCPFLDPTASPGFSDWKNSITMMEIQFPNIERLFLRSGTLDRIILGETLPRLFSAPSSLHSVFVPIEFLPSSILPHGWKSMTLHPSLRRIPVLELGDFSPFSANHANSMFVCEGEPPVPSLYTSQDQLSRHTTCLDRGAISLSCVSEWAPPRKLIQEVPALKIMWSILVNEKSVIELMKSLPKESLRKLEISVCYITARSLDLLPELLHHLTIRLVETPADKNLIGDRRPKIDPEIFAPLLRSQSHFPSSLQSLTIIDSTRAMCSVFLSNPRWPLALPENLKFLSVRSGDPRRLLEPNRYISDITSVTYASMPSSLREFTIDNMQERIQIFHRFSSSLIQSLRLKTVFSHLTTIVVDYISGEALSYMTSLRALTVRSKIISLLPTHIEQILPTLRYFTIGIIQKRTILGYARRNKGIQKSNSFWLNCELMKAFKPQSYTLDLQRSRHVAQKEEKLAVLQVPDLDHSEETGVAPLSMVPKTLEYLCIHAASRMSLSSFGVEGLPIRLTHLEIRWNHLDSDARRRVESRTFEFLPPTLTYLSIEPVKVNKWTDLYRKLPFSLVYIFLYIMRISKKLSFDAFDRKKFMAARKNDDCTNCVYRGDVLKFCHLPPVIDLLCKETTQSSCIEAF